MYTREDDLTQGTYRPAYKSIYKAAFNNKNELIAFSVKGVGLPADRYSQIDFQLEPLRII